MASHPAALTSEAPDSGGGLYVLLLELGAPARLEVGRLGVFDAAAGWYAYAGSAHGPGGLRGRLAHHLRPVRTPHWHIDVLREVAPLRQIWWAHAAAADEHSVAAALLALPGGRLPFPRFGASDCKCAAHLVWFAAPPAFVDWLHVAPAHGWRPFGVAPA